MSAGCKGGEAACRGKAIHIPKKALSSFVLCALVLLGLAPDSFAGDDVTPAWMPQFLGFQANLIEQRLPPMHSPYEGTNSLPGNGDSAFSHSYVVSTGAQLAPGVQAYLDLRLQRGAAINNGSGLAGFPNGDFVPGGPSAPPYFNHAYIRYYIPFGSASTKIEKGLGKLPNQEPVERLEFKVGRILPTDDFDKNRYMDNPATQFFNLGLVNNPAWDYAQNSKGVTNGVMVGWFGKRWAFRLGSYQMPTTAGGHELESGLRSRNDNAELVWQPNPEGITLRLLAYHNRAPMGRYDDAAALARATAQPADISLTRRQGRHKLGAGFSLELPLADDGDTGLFGCAAWNDGKTEDFSFTESDRNLCFGTQISGARWNRKEDRFSIALLINGLTSSHRDYLSLGGTGIQLGDGRLNYGTERVLEMYYFYQANKHVAFSPDLQVAQNPGFNRDRGPAVFLGARLVLSF